MNVPSLQLKLGFVFDAGCSRTIYFADKSKFGTVMEHCRLEVSATFLPALGSCSVLVKPEAVILVQPSAHFLQATGNK